jgi:hypothetical protein
MWQAAAVKDAAAKAVALRPSLTATACHAVGNSGRDEKTALQPNQKTANKTEILYGLDPNRLTREGSLRKCIPKEAPAPQHIQC